MDHVFLTKIEKSRKNNKNLSSQIFVVRNIVNDPLNVWSNYYMPFIVTRILFRIRRLSELGVYKETFIKGLNKVLSAAHLQNKSLKTILEQTFYMKVLAEVVLWFSIKYSYIFSCFFFLWEDDGTFSRLAFAAGNWRFFHYRCECSLYFGV